MVILILYYLFCVITNCYQRYWVIYGIGTSQYTMVMVRYINSGLGTSISIIVIYYRNHMVRVSISLDWCIVYTLLLSLISSLLSTLSLFSLIFYILISLIHYHYPLFSILLVHCMVAWFKGMHSGLLLVGIIYIIQH
jgi:hypothetical protein